MRRLFKLSLVLITLAGFVSCHKYPEDPFISLKNPQDRLSGIGSGYTWKITSYQINGVEHSHDFDNFLSPHTLTDITFTFHPLIPREGTQVYSINELNIRGINWSIENNIISLGINYYGVPIDSVAYKFDRYVLKNVGTIIELYGKHLHITNYGTDIYFKKQ
ncbi:MAG: hypothetical protein ACYDCN_04790 [Bacteroidia bacterium]